MNRKTGQNSRRSFIRNVLLMGGAAPLLAGVARAAGPGLKKKSEGRPDPYPSQGYRETPHIRQYYKKLAS
ncbi:hypothetical protein [Desulfobacula sp.]|uniref:hypothetical protein n=1 Tax=Desulfobacula sp. TaxID=2593537 RepID=UPI002626BDB6|nr:hypothetical protein [Desulfobacula sp.]